MFVPAASESSPADMTTRFASLANELRLKLEDRLPEQYFTPEALACLFLFNSFMGKEAEQFQLWLAQSLLDRTIRHAKDTVPYYRHLYADAGVADDQPFRLDELRCLPVVTRDDLESEGPALKSDRLEYGFSTYTSGTTSQRPLIVDRSREEQSFLTAFFAALRPEVVTNQKPVALYLANWYHGQTVEIPSSFQLVPVSVSSMTGLRTARDLLLREYRTGEAKMRVSAIGGSLISLNRLTEYLEHEGVRSHLPSMEFLQSTSEYATPRVLRRLREFWACTVEDRYGLSEINIGAWRCGNCGSFHFEPYGLVEVIGLTDNEPVNTGRGRLVLTGFYPFMQMTPLIRYVTGDVVEIEADSCPTGQRRYRLLGRLAKSLVRRGAVLLGEYEIIDVLDEEPEVLRHRPYVTLTSCLQDVGAPPIYSFFTEADGRASLEVAVRYDPKQFAAQAKALATRISSALNCDDEIELDVRLALGEENASIYMF